MGNIYDSTINGVNQKTNMFLLKQNYTFHMILNAWVNNGMNQEHNDLFQTSSYIMIA